MSRASSLRRDLACPACGPDAGEIIIVEYVLGSAYVDYGLGNFAFYDNSPPENASGSLVIAATGRHIDQVTWRPAVIVDDLPSRSRATPPPRRSPPGTRPDPAPTWP